jgi:Dolichyl-phosphate-mannose-protein mannosyltransferase
VANANFLAPPRFDGAGYAVLGQSLATGRGYCEIDHPESPRHAHFPPGYPTALAIIWLVAGRSVAAAHLFSVICTVAAVLLAWRWFCTIYPKKLALLLALALAVNWSWGRGGGSIQSEPFYVLVQFIAVLISARAGRRNTVGIGVVLGLALGACILIRHVGVCLAAAVLVDLAMRRHWRTFWAAVLATAAVIFPWILWLGVVHQNTQVGLLAEKNWAGQIPGQALFYVQRLPDQIVGPLVEVATVFGRSPALAGFANLWAVAATAIIVFGWICTLPVPRRRLAGLIGLVTIALLLIWPFTEAGRFLFPIVPFMLVGASEGLARIMALVGFARGSARAWACGLVLAMSVPYAAYAIATGRAEAQRRTHVDFDTACDWIKTNAAPSDLVLTRHPGEVFWQTGRQALAPDSPEPEAIDRLIRRFDVVYLLIDEDRFANESSSPLSNYVKRYFERVAPVWSSKHDGASIKLFEVKRPR